MKVELRQLMKVVLRRLMKVELRRLMKVELEQKRSSDVATRWILEFLTREFMKPLHCVAKLQRQFTVTIEKHTINDTRIWTLVWYINNNESSLIGIHY